jgi:capsule polysaccharide export protein KpsE/RkpR
MQYAVYQGTIVKAEDTQGKLVNVLEDDGTSLVANADELVPVPEDMIPAITAVHAEIKELKNRMHLLESAYLGKMEVLRIKYMDARSEELRIANRVLHTGREKKIERE